VRCSGRWWRESDAGGEQRDRYCGAGAAEPQQPVLRHYRERTDLGHHDGALSWRTVFAERRGPVSHSIQRQRTGDGCVGQHYCSANGGAGQRPGVHQRAHDGLWWRRGARPGAWTAADQLWRCGADGSFQRDHGSGHRDVCGQAAGGERDAVVQSGAEQHQSYGQLVGAHLWTERRHASGL